MKETWLFRLCFWPQSAELKLARLVVLPLTVLALPRPQIQTGNVGVAFGIASGVVAGAAVTRVVAGVTACAARPLSRVPDKAEALEGSDTLVGDMARLLLHELFVLTALVVYPRTELGVLAVVSRDDTIPVPRLVFAQLAEPLAPDSLMGIPAKADTVEVLGPFFRHVRRFVLFHERVVTALLLHPQPKLGILGVVQRYETVTKLVAKPLQIAHVAFPCSLLCVPCKVERVEQIDAARCNGARLAVSQKLVLLPLLRDPGGQARIQRISTRNDAITVFLLVSLELLVGQEPLGVLRPLGRFVGLGLLALPSLG